MSMTPHKAGNETILGSLVASLRTAGAFNANAETRPAAILWTDKDREWEDLLPRLRSQLHGLLTHGAYEPTERQGPALWLKAALAEQVPGVVLPASEVPILYLPGISRADLRVIGDAPKELQPLAELQFRGAFWSQKNGKDWTLRAYLTSPHGGLDLDMAEDKETLTACQEVLLDLVDRDLATLKGKRLEATDFHNLLTPDLARDLLAWLGDPEGTKAKWQGKKWKGFCALCVEQLGFHPQKEGHLAAAEHLSGREGGWATIWQRFEDSPHKYPQVTKRLEEALPKQVVVGVLTDYSANPNHNRNEESALKEALQKLPKLDSAQARAKLLELESAHGGRRQWVWAQLGQSPLAVALEHLATLARASATALVGSEPESLAADYAQRGWPVDDAVLRAMEGLPPADETTVKEVVRALYLEWLEQGAKKLQAVVKTKGYPKPSPVPAEAEPGTVLLFADGLRFDVGQRLKDMLAGDSWRVTVGRRWTAFPPVTATCKPAIAPIPPKLVGGPTGKDFSPSEIGKETPLSGDRFQKLLKEQGWQILSREDRGDPEGKGWLSFGDLDHYGHAHQWRLAQHLEGQLDALAALTISLLDWGWKRVEVVTDHGWLLLPGGLPKYPATKDLTVTQWPRCAMLKSGAVPDDLPQVPWHWNSDLEVVSARGCGVFQNGEEYAHGGLSLQECVVPVLYVDSGTGTVQGTFESVQWKGQRCRLKFSGNLTQAKVDLRVKAGDPGTSVIAGGVPVSENGQATFLVENGDLAETQAFLVLLNADGTPVAKQSTVIGGES